MGKATTVAIAAAALSGLLAGTNARAATAVSHSGTNFTQHQVGQKAISLDGDKHSCKGENSCKGKGGCKTGDNGCKAKNSCKSKGGCSTMDDGATTKPTSM